MTTLLPDKISSLSKVKKSKLSNVRFRCEYPDCQKLFSTKRNRGRHVLIHHENRRLHCEYTDCQKSYTTKQHLEDHVSSYHEKRRFHCEYSDCRKSYTEKQNLEDHVLSYHDKKDKKYLCKQLHCGAIYSSRSGLSYHIRVKKCQPSLSKTENDRKAEKIVFLETHLADIDSQIETVAALILGFDSFECDECLARSC